MILRLSLLIAVLSQVSACVMIPRAQLVDRIDFNYMQPDQTVLSYADLLCCYDCTA